MTSFRVSATQVKPSETSRSAADPTSSSVAATRVLVVDDTPSLRRVVCDLLEWRGFIVAGEASCPPSALAAIERLDPDAVVLDVNLADESGFDLCAALSLMRPDLPILMVSAGNEETGAVLAKHSGACGFVPKAQLARAELSAFLPSRVAAAHPAT